LEAFVFIVLCGDLHGMADASNLEAAARLQILHFQPDSPSGQPEHHQLSIMERKKKPDLLISLGSDIILG
jgi:hypothetical protein